MNRFARRLSLVGPTPSPVPEIKEEGKDQILKAAKFFVHLNRQHPDLLAELRGRREDPPSVGMTHDLLVLLEDHLLLLQYVLIMIDRPLEKRSMRAAHRRLFPSHPVQFHLLAQNILQSLRLAQYPAAIQVHAGQVLDQWASELSCNPTLSPSVPVSPAQSPAPSMYAQSAFEEGEGKGPKNLSRRLFGWMRG
ncbi:hypothetical protein BJ684DRAFT_21278 [Piptocephalis cylindrospora]|uniref:Uncharacterized protein n=1 Tax=Piptocephalis cylindrospora TaxID=1907219 RepID=A0A4P9Y281_9FUNG|nr:hypothetical protein BJ684DRAFT_21278 [Piptocephalis cylindrospora]|eukprot:RKP12161.1 hypothetical protein BJ684DRAFT_21278 [Piptocephalis cylindrospora]